MPFGRCASKGKAVRGGLLGTEGILDLHFLHIHLVRE